MVGPHRGVCINNTGSISQHTALLPVMASALKILSLLQLLTFFYCISAADIKEADKTGDTSEDIKTVEAEDDLDTEETGWMAMGDPIQKKLREIEYAKAKLLSPFMTLKSPTFNYGGGYPVYGVSGSTGFSAGAHYSNQAPSFVLSPPKYWGKPLKTAAPSYSQNLWSNKGLLGMKLHQGSPLTYAPNCDHTTSSWKPISVSVPLNPTYSAGTPLLSHHSSASPAQTYGTPFVNFSAKSSISSSFGQSGSTVPSLQQIAVPVVVSDSTGLKSSEPPKVQSFQNVNPSSYWSSVGSFPSSPTWSSASGSLPSQSSSFISNPNWYGTGSYFPNSAGTSQLPGALSSSSQWGGASGYYPVPATGSQSSYVPTTSSPPSWPSITSSSQHPSQTSSTGFSSYFLPGSQYVTPSPNAQQYFVVPPTPASSTVSDQEEVSITPPPVQVKSNFVSTFPGSNIVLPIDSSVYSPGSSYFGSYFPNVFYITNEQHVDKPNTPEVSDQERSTIQLIPVDTNSSSENIPSSTENSSVSTQSPATPLVLKSSVQTAFNPFSTGGHLKFTVYPLPPPVISPNGFYSSPVQGSYPIPVSSSLIGTSSVGVSQSPSSQIIPATRTRTSLNSFPVSWGYRYNLPSVAFQSGLQSHVTAKASPPC